jgi:hypothetical protein
MVAYNGSPEAQTALGYGVKKAHEMGGELIVFHMLRRPYFLEMEGILPTEDAFRRILLVKKDTLMHRSGCKIFTTFVFAVVDDTCHDILRYADQAEVDLIVVPPEFEELLEKACCLVDVA